MSKTAKINAKKNLSNTILYYYLSIHPNPVVHDEEKIKKHNKNIRDTNHQFEENNKWYQTQY